MQNTYGSIPDEIPTKPFLPLGENFWNLIKELGWQYFNEDFTDKQLNFFGEVAEFLRDKFHTTVKTAQKVISGLIKNPKNIFATFFFPPVLYARSDLQSGATKLLYGESTDITFVAINDSTYLIELLINCHMEGGIPVDYWLIRGEDEVFDRRHLKLGYKLREIPSKINNFIESGSRIIEILRDIRNERNPEFSFSAYSMAMVWASGAYNMFIEPSNYNTVAQLWDGATAPRSYGMPDYYYCYVPWPPMIKMLLNLGRSGFTNRIAGLLSENRLFINAIEPRQMKLEKEIIPEVWEISKRNMKEKGVPTPGMTLLCKPPDLKNKMNYDIEKFDWIYPNQTRVMPYEWGLTDEEVFGGIYTDITNETPPKESYGKEHIISMGIGK
ncbi:MAG: hypothetical protein HWN67_01925 [Candidatus Helarchaeota archaeon]|nr:hypothetical protein [Candidatus Helarchaeota archaeon]